MALLKNTVEEDEFLDMWTSMDSATVKGLFNGNYNSYIAAVAKVPSRLDSLISQVAELSILIPPTPRRPTPLPPCTPTPRDLEASFPALNSP